jgi:uncharacterized membrane protein
MQRCFITNKLCSPDESVSGGQIRKTIYDFIKDRYPDFNEKSHLSTEAYNDMRADYVAGLIQNEIGELTDMEKEVVQAIGKNQILSENVEEEEDRESTFGERVADRVAAFGGSWTFLISFFAVLLGWIGLNMWFLQDKGFDPYPFILLNLILSCLAAVQAPVIMMSQNRQADKDRARSEHDYKVNLKAEVEIRLLHEKVDHLLIHEQRKLLEIQQVQIELMQGIQKSISVPTRPPEGSPAVPDASAGTAAHPGSTAG